MPEHIKSKFEVIVELVRVLVWPALLVTIVLMFLKPLRETVYLLPSLVANSSELTIAGVKVNIDKSIRSKASDEVLISIAKLSPNGFESLIDLTKGTIVFQSIELDRYKHEYNELLELKLIEIKSWTGDRNYDYSLGVTGLGRDVQQFFFVIVSDISGKLISVQKDIKKNQ